MKFKAVLFDLDGTLLPMDQDVFVKAYFGGLAKKGVAFGLDPELLIKTVWQGVGAMVKNTGEATNEKIFWETFVKTFGGKAEDYEPIFNEYYLNDFPKVKEVCGFSEHSAEIVHTLNKKGVRVVLATNPIFPPIATESRIRWAGLEPNDFELYTTYESCCHCKPNPEYYEDILNLLNLKPEDCLMVGNDVGEDMVAKSLGMEVFLLKDCIINKEGADISVFSQGGFKELKKYLEI